MIGLHQLHILQKGLRIFGAEDDQVHHGRVKDITGHCLGIEWIAHKYIAFSQTVRKPLRVEGRDICTIAGLDDHGTPHYQIFCVSFL